MKELANIFTRQYSVVSTRDEHNVETNSNELSIRNNRRKSLKATRGLPKGLALIDSFFNKRKTGENTRLPTCAFLLLVAGVLLVTTAVLIKIFQPYHLIFKWKLVFEEGGEIFNLWEKPPVDLYVKIYLFNITNAEAFLAGKEKINVEEIGPYVYKELMTHENVVFNENGTVSTNPKHPLVWQEHLSEGHQEDDEVVMLNIAMLAFAQVGNERGYFFRTTKNMLLLGTGQQPIARMTAKEFMFGYETSLTTIGNKVFPNWIKFDKVGLIDRMYDFDNDFETFYTGEDNPKISGLYATYKGSPNLTQWEESHCSSIDMASDGTKFQSYLQEKDSVLFFRKSMCRPQRLIREGPEKQFGSLKGFTYVFEKNALDNGINDEKNKCFCREGYCQPNGLIDVTDCYYGFPISLSYPHFLDGDEDLVKNVTGLNPDRAKHTSYFNIQPQSGLPLSISAKVQINMHMRDVRAMAKVGKFSFTTVPMVWFDITMNQLPKSLENRFFLYLNVLPYLDILGFWVSLIGGIACIILGITKAALKLPTLLDGANNNIQSLQKKWKMDNPCEMVLMNGSDEEVYKAKKLSRDENLYILEKDPPISYDKIDGDEYELSDEAQIVNMSECDYSYTATAPEENGIVIGDNLVNQFFGSEQSGSCTTLRIVEDSDDEMPKCHDIKLNRNVLL